MKSPIISVTINNSLRRALVDTGCTTTIVHSSVAEECKNIPSYVAAFDGSIVERKRRGGLEIEVGDKVIVVDAIVVDKTVEGVDIVMGIDAINQLGGVTLGNGIIKFGYVNLQLVLVLNPFRSCVLITMLASLRTRIFMLNLMVHIGLWNGFGRKRSHQC